VISSTVSTVEEMTIQPPGNLGARELAESPVDDFFADLSQHPPLTA
jgi:hypothetical protein